MNEDRPNGQNEREGQARPEGGNSESEAFIADFRINTPLTRIFASVNYLCLSFIAFTMARESSHLMTLAFNEFSPLTGGLVSKLDSRLLAVGLWLCILLAWPRHRKRGRGGLWFWHSGRTANVLHMLSIMCGVLAVSMGGILQHGGDSASQIQTAVLLGMALIVLPCTILFASLRDLADMWQLPINRFFTPR